MTAHSLNKLTVVMKRSAAKPGKYGDGGGFWPHKYEDGGGWAI